jgi:endonuclease/exonuclease/phosphatase family metal-dependent hydrolase
MPGVGCANAVLSRWPIVKVEAIPLPPGDAEDEGRGALGCHIDTPYGLLPFITTHLNAGWAQSSIRADQLRRIGQWLIEAPDTFLPPVLTGDLNAGDDFDEIRALSGKRDALVPGLALVDAWWATNPGEPGYTWDPANPLIPEPLPSRIDYVFAGFSNRRGALRPTAARRFGTAPYYSVWPSDHYGVAVDFSVLGDIESP